MMSAVGGPRRKSLEMTRYTGNNKSGRKQVGGGLIFHLDIMHY